MTRQIPEFWGLHSSLGSGGTVCSYAWSNKQECKRFWFFELERTCSQLPNPHLKIRFAYVVNRWEQKVRYVSNYTERNNG